MSGDSRIQNVELPYATIVETTVPSTPAAGRQRYFIDPADHKLKLVNSSGTITTIGDASAISGAFGLTGDITPSQITVDQNDYNPTGLSTASTLRLSSDASRNITGLAGGSDGRVLIVHNVGAANIVLKDESASSTAANRFALTADITLAADAVCVLQYDSTSTRWRAVSGGGGGGTPGSLQLLGTYVASSSATIDITSKISGSYDQYVIELINLVPANNGVDFYMRVSTDNGLNWDSAGNYMNNHNLQATSGNTSVVGLTSTQIMVRGNAEISNASGKFVNGTIKLYQPLSSGHKIFGGNIFWEGGSNYINTDLHGGYHASGQVNAIRFFFSAGNIVSGTIKIYGIS